MDPTTLAITAATLLATKAAEAVGGEVGRGAWAGLTRLYEAIRSRFVGDVEAAETLSRMEAKPASQARAAELAEVLEERLRADPGFAAELAGLVEEVKADPGAASFVTRVQDNARVGRITNIGSVGGDVHL